MQPGGLIFLNWERNVWAPTQKFETDPQVSVRERPKERHQAKRTFRSDSVVVDRVLSRKPPNYSSQSHVERHTLLVFSPPQLDASQCSLRRGEPLVFVDSAEYTHLGFFGRFPSTSLSGEDGGSVQESSEPVHEFFALLAKAVSNPASRQEDQKINNIANIIVTDNSASYCEDAEVSVRGGNRRTQVRQVSV